jgi:hypothetical protein
MRQGRSLSPVDPLHAQLGPEDLEYLRLHWAVSPVVGALCQYLAEHRFELQAGTDSILETSDLAIRGQLDARRTALLRATTGHPTAVTYRSVQKSFFTGPNQVLAWVLAYADRYALQWTGKLPPVPVVNDARDSIRRTVVSLVEVRRINIVRDALGAFRLPARPTSQALQQAKTSRRQVYQLAFAAYANLLAIEGGDNDTVRRLLEETLIKPKENYQLLELAMAVSLARAAGERLNVPVRLHEITLGGNQILLSVGEYDIHWQAQTKSYSPPELEPAEAVYYQLLADYNLRNPQDRPDIVIKRGEHQVVSIGEAKSFGKEDAWSQRLRSALAQIVRYTRGYRPAGQLEGLISQSCIALSHYPTAERVTPTPAQGPVVLDSEDLIAGHVDEWLDRILAHG